MNISSSFRWTEILSYQLQLTRTWVSLLLVQPITCHLWEITSGFISNTSPTSWWMWLEKAVKEKQQPPSFSNITSQSSLSLLQTPASFLKLILCYLPGAQPEVCVAAGCAVCKQESWYGHANNFQKQKRLEGLRTFSRRNLLLSASKFVYQLSKQAAWY